MAMINSNHIVVTSDPQLIDALWEDEECILLERHCDKNGIPVSESWIIPHSFRVPGERLQVGQKTA